jgi:hypothetical protein
METALAILVGIGLAAACGFRLFVPPLVISIAALSGHLALAKGFAWMGTWPALLAFATATVLEVAAYHVPWLDHLMDTLASPAAVVAGAVVAASAMGDLDPFLRWTLALIAGGGAAGFVQVATVKGRILSALTTFGIANPLVATVETAASIAVSVLSVLAPLLAGLLLIGTLSLAAWLLLRRRAA